MKPHALAGFVLAFAVVASGCASPGAADSLAPPADVLSEQAQLSQLHERILGTLGDRTAGEFITYMKVQGGIKACMSGVGLDYAPPSFVDPYAGYRTLPAPDMYQQIVPVDDTYVRENGLQLANILSAPASEPSQASAPPDAPYNAKLEACKTSIGDPSGTNFPSAATDLEGELERVVGSVVETPDVQSLSASYAGCMKAAGYAGVSSRDDLLGVIRQEFAPQTANAPASGAKWEKAVHDEQVAAAADGACRYDAYVATMTKLEQPLQQFVENHQQQLLGVDSTWTQTRAAASALAASNGWAGVHRAFVG
jgi:hypothetical protein